MKLFRKMCFLLFCSLCLTTQIKADEFYVKDGCSVKNIVISNGSLEKEIAKTGGEKPVSGEWYYNQSHGQYVTDAALAHSGNGCAKISGMEAATASDFIWTLITIQPKTYYRIRGWIKTENVKSNAYIFVYQVDSNNKVVANSRSEFVTGTQGWNESEYCIQTAKGRLPW